MYSHTCIAKDKLHKPHIEFGLLHSFRQCVSMSVCLTSFGQPRVAILMTKIDDCVVTTGYR